jgi:DNA-binding IclR family transcriptional regulator
MDYNVTEIAEKSNLKRDTVYKYLDTLRAWGLVEKTRKVGNSQMFSLNNDSAAAESLAKFEWDLIEHLAEKEDAGELNDNNEPVI